MLGQLHHLRLVVLLKAEGGVRVRTTPAIVVMNFAGVRQGGVHTLHDTAFREQLTSD